VRTIAFKIVSAGAGTLRPFAARGRCPARIRAGPRRAPTRTSAYRATIVPCSPSVSWRSTAHRSTYVPGASSTTTRAEDPGRSGGLVASVRVRSSLRICSRCTIVPSLRTTIVTRPAGTRTACGAMRYSDSVSRSGEASIATGAGSPQPAHAVTAAAAATVASARGGSRGIAAGFFRMMRGRMPRPAKSLLLPLAALALSLGLAACGEQQIEVASTSPQHSGAELFQQRCAGCHTFSAAATQGSAANVRTRERTDGPNFNTRRECIERVLYAIENGGFSGAIMPQNIVVGEQARAVADFVAHYAGRDADGPRPDGSGSAATGFHCTPAGGGSGGGVPAGAENPDSQTGAGGD
jgi:mono/diheme cytochrome c family protein